MTSRIARQVIALDTHRLPVTLAALPRLAVRETNGAVHGDASCAASPRPSDPGGTTGHSSRIGWRGCRLCLPPLSYGRACRTALWAAPKGVGTSSSTLSPVAQAPFRR